MAYAWSCVASSLCLYLSPHPATLLIYSNSLSLPLFFQVRVLVAASVIFRCDLLPLLGLVALASLLSPSPPASAPAPPTVPSLPPPVSASPAVASPPPLTPASIRLALLRQLILHGAATAAASVVATVTFDSM